MSIAQFRKSLVGLELICTQLKASLHQVWYLPWSRAGGGVLPGPLSPRLLAELLGVTALAWSRWTLP